MNDLQAWALVSPILVAEVFALYFIVQHWGADIAMWIEAKIRGKQ